MGTDLGQAEPATAWRRGKSLIDYTIGSIIFAGLTAALLFGANFGSLVGCFNS